MQFLLVLAEQRAMCTFRALCLASQASSFESAQSLLPLVEQSARVHPPFRDSSRPSCRGLIASFPGPFSSSGGRLPAALFTVFQLDSKGAKVRFSWFFYRIQKVQKCANLVDPSRAFKRVFSIYLQHSASIQPRTRLSKFAKK